MDTFSINPDNYAAYAKIDVSILPSTHLGKEWLHHVWITSSLDDKKFSDGIDIDKWGYSCEQKSRLKIMQNECQIITWAESENSSSKVHGVGDAILGEIDANLDDVLEEASFPIEISKFLEIRAKLMVEENIDLYYLIKKAKFFNNLALEKLKFLCEKYHIENLLETILNPKCFNLLKKTIYKKEV
ncbi:hypothetical protein QVA93_11100 [Clostridioides difficile]|nr:hypothetical protein [Clostridioides difficile]